MENRNFTFRAENGAPTFEFPGQSALRAELNFDLGAIAGAPKRPINHPRSRASRAPALQPKNNTSFAATTANVKFDFGAESSAAASATNSSIIDSPALGETYNKNTHLFRFQGHLDTPTKSTGPTSLAVETEAPVVNPLPASASSRRNLDELDRAYFSTFYNNPQEEFVCVDDISVLECRCCGPSNGVECRIVSKGRKSLGEELKVKGDNVF